MPARLLLCDQAQRMIGQRLSSGKWWGFLGDLTTIQKLEDEFFAGEASGDFEGVIGPNQFGTIAIFFGRKSRLSAAQLSQFLNRHRSFRKQNIILLQG